MDENPHEIDSESYDGLNELTDCLNAVGLNDGDFKKIASGLELIKDMGGFVEIIYSNVQNRFTIRVGFYDDAVLSDISADERELVRATRKSFFTIKEITDLYAVAFRWTEDGGSLTKMALSVLDNAETITNDLMLAVLEVKSGDAVFQMSRKLNGSLLLQKIST